MKTLRSLNLVAALALASTVYAHAETADPCTGIVVKPVSTMVGMNVRTPNGKTLGTVREVLRDEKGDASYAVIFHGGFMGFRGKRTAVPWANLRAMIRGNALVIERSVLEQAPVLAGGTPATSSGAWSRDADHYWRIAAPSQPPPPSAASAK